jgi:hypothetical protein
MVSDTETPARLDVARSPMAVSVTVSLVLMTAQWTGIRPVGDIAIAEFAIAGAVVALGAQPLWEFARTAPWVLWLPVIALVGLDVIPGRDDAEMMGVATAGSLFVCWYVIAEGPRRGRIPWPAVIDLVVWSSVVNATVAVASAVTGGVLAWPTAPDFPGREVGLTTHPTQLALFCVLALSLVLFRSFDDGGSPVTTRTRVTMTLTSVMLAAGVMASGSRAGLVVAGLLVVIWMGTELASVRSSAKGRPVLAVGLGLVVVAATIVAGLVLGLFDRGWQSFEQSDVLRAGNLRDALELARASPMTGAGSDHLLSAHNLPVQLVAAGGLVLLGAFLPLLWVAARPAFARVPFGPSVAVVAWLAFSMVQNPIIDRFVHLMIAIAVVSHVRSKSPLTPCVLTRR